jgi:hypothetical protein
MEMVTASVSGMHVPTALKVISSPCMAVPEARTSVASKALVILYPATNGFGPLWVHLPAATWLAGQSFPVYVNDKAMGQSGQEQIGSVSSTISSQSAAAPSITVVQFKQLSMLQSPVGVIEGAGDGSADGSGEGPGDGGSENGAGVGSAEGSAEGSGDGGAEGSAEGAGEGSADGEGVGSAEGAALGNESMSSR